MTYSQLIFDLMSLKRGQLSDDDIGDERQYEFWINNTRALLIRQDFAKNRSLSENIIQDLGCVEMENADVAECCVTDYGCSIKRTKLLIPKPIEFNQFDGIIRVGLIDKTAKPFTFVPYEQFIYSGNGRYNTKNVFATYKSNRIYLRSSINSLTLSAMKWTNIRGIFEDPRSVSAFTRCNGTSCYTSEDQYPISAWMVEVMKKMILDIDIKTMLTIPADNVNNATGTNPQSPQQ